MLLQDVLALLALRFVPKAARSIDAILRGPILMSERLRHARSIRSLLGDPRHDLQVVQRPRLLEQFISPNHTIALSGVHRV